MNKFVGIGRLTAEPQVRYAAETQTAICKFCIAVDDGYGEKKKTNFINVIAFGKTAENCEKFTGKGLRIAVEGKLQSGSYDNKEGKKVYTLDVVADRIEFIDWKNSGNQTHVQEENPFDDFAALSEDCPF
jgi:single-strand DNA-binding protein